MTASYVSGISTRNLESTKSKYQIGSGEYK